MPGSKQAMFRGLLPNASTPSGPTVNWKMMLESADGAAHLVVGWTFALTGVAGTNDIVTATAGADLPAGWVVQPSANGLTVLCVDVFGVGGLTVPSTGTVEGMLIGMTNTNTLPLGTLGAGPELTQLTTTGGVSLAGSLYVQTLGSAAPGIKTQNTAASNINSYLIQL